MSYPFSIRWMVHSDIGNIPPVQVIFSARKKNFKRAVHRNRIKRLLREVYRNQKNGFYNYLDQHQIKIYLSVVFVGSQIGDYRLFNHKMQEIIQKITSQINLRNENNPAIQ